LKVKLFEMFPEVAKNTLDSEYARQRLESCIQTTWNTLDDKLFNKLGASIPDRIEACLTANG
jgi:hypothetical protein